GLGGGFEGGEGEYARDQEELVEIGVHVVVVGVAPAGAVEAAGNAGLPEMRGVVARVALGQSHAQVLGIAAGERLQVSLDHLDHRLRHRHVHRGLGESAETAGRLGGNSISYWNSGSSALRASSVCRKSARTVSPLWLVLNRTLT